MLERAHTVCGCTPWNFPYIASGDIEICDLFGSTCFFDLMSDTGFGEQCDCPEDCDEVSFSKFETSKDLNADELCTDTNSWVYKYMRTVKRNVEGYDYRQVITYNRRRATFCLVFWWSQASLWEAISVFYTS